MGVFECVCVFPYNTLVNCFGRTVLYMCMEYCISVDRYYVNAKSKSIDEHMINLCTLLVLVLLLLLFLLPSCCFFFSFFLPPLI